MTSPAIGIGGEELAALARLAEQIFADRIDPKAAGLEPRYDADLWAVLEEAGLTLLGVPEAAGGTGGGLAASAAVLASAAAHGAPVPLAETDFLAGWLLSDAGLPVPPGPLTATAGELTVVPAADGARVSGRLERVPWGRDAVAVAVLAVAGDGPDTVLVVPGGAVAVEPGANVAREPRDTLLLDDVLITQTAPAPAGARTELELRGALARCVQIAAAAATAVDWTVRYTREREQFGRPIARFQAVQQQLAEAAAESAAAGAAADAAVRIAGADGFATVRAGLAVAIAKAQASAAAGLVARTAHQLHGTIGFTFEHPLRTLTTRLWSWRSECGDEARWNRVAGQAALDAGDQFWHSLTGWS